MKIKINCIAQKIVLASFLSAGMVSNIQAQTGAYTLNGGSASPSSLTETSSTADQSGIYVYNSGTLTVGTVNVTTSGNASSTDNSSMYGVNAAILAGTSSSKGVITITGSSNSIVTTGSAANGLFATYSGSSISMADGTIMTYGAFAHGVDATYGASITLSNVNMTSWGTSSALATDFGGGTVTVTGGTISTANTTGPGPTGAGIYSTGNIMVTGATVSSAGDCGGVIDGGNSISLTNTTLSGSAAGIKIWKTAPMSGTATVIVNGGSVAVTSGDAFLVTGTTGNAAAGNITVLSNATITASTGNILNVASSSTATFTVSAATLTGNLIADSTSTMTNILQNGATLTGCINTAKLLTIDATSTWNATSNSIVSTLTNSGTINGPGIVTAATVNLQGGAINTVLAGSAGLTKTTASNATLSATNTYTGGTTVSNGTLFVNGRIAASTVNIGGGSLAGNGSLAGAVNIRSGGMISPGVNDTGTLTISNALTLYGGSSVTMEINRTTGLSDVLRVTDLLTFAGSLRVTNLSGTFAPGDSFQLFRAGSYTGGFTNVTLPALASGLAWNTNELATSGTISVISTLPVFNAPVLSGGTNLIFSGTTLATNQTYYVLVSTDIAAPMAQWTRLATNPITAGQFLFTNAIDPSVPHTFYRVQFP